MHSLSLIRNRAADIVALHRLAYEGLPDECGDCGAECRGTICDACAAAHVCPDCHGERGFWVYSPHREHPRWEDCRYCEATGEI